MNLITSFVVFGSKSRIVFMLDGYLNGYLLAYLIINTYILQKMEKLVKSIYGM